MSHLQDKHVPSGRDGARIRALSRKQTDLDLQISEEMNRPLPDTLRLSHLKRIKLRFKDEMRAIIVARVRENDAPPRRTGKRYAQGRRYA